MSDKKKGLFIALTVLFVVMLTGIASALSGRIPQNPEDTVGNTAGNLNNNGLFCETEDKIYFANAYDNQKLYAMNKDGSGIEKIRDVSVQFLCNGGSYLYYYQNSSDGGTGLGYLRSVSGLYRMNTKNNTLKGLSRYGSGALQLVGNHIYYKHYTKDEGVCLYTISTVGKEDTLLLKQADAMSPACVWNKQLYFTDTGEKRGLYVYDTQTGSMNLCREGNIWFPQIADGYVYYMNADNNYSLCRFPINDTQSAPEQLTTDRVDTFLVYEGQIYYQKNDANAPALMRMLPDGTNPECVIEGIFENINGAGGNVYFNSFSSKTPVYTTPVSGAVSVNEFDAAKEAALQNIATK